MRAKLEVATAILHNDVYNMNKQGEVLDLQNALDEAGMRKAKGVAIRSMFYWSKVGHMCLVEFLKSIIQKTLRLLLLNSKTTMVEFLPRGRIWIEFVMSFIKKKLYSHKDICHVTLRELLKGFHVTFTRAINDTLV